MAMMTDKFTARLRQGSIDIGCIQDQGAREYQEDSVGFSPLPGEGTAERFLAVVADGMGGMASGAFVSGYTVKNLLAADIGSPEELKAAACRISGEIAAGGSRGGTTLAAVCVLPGGVYFCSVGDSRIYLFRDGVLARLTADQDYMSVLLDRVIDGKISWLQAQEDPERNALAQFVGSGMLLSPDMNCVPLAVQPGDRLLICSDGVYNALSEAELSQSLTLTAGGASEDILGRILAHGYTNQDNFTAVVMHFLPGWNSDDRSDDVPSEKTTLHIDSAFHTGAGGRDENQDALFCGGGVYAVADGLGGHKNGGKAARAAVDHISARSSGDLSPEGVNALFEGANTAVGRTGGKAAAAAAFARDGVFTWGHVGDCRVYYFRGGRITFQTRDHSVCQAAVELGQITPEDIRGNEDRSGLMKALGSEPELDIRERCEPLGMLPGDAFLVCTDGFWEHVHEREMETDLIKSRSAAEWLNSMLKRHMLSAHDSGDNYTAVCGIVTNTPEPQETSPVRQRSRFPVLIPVGIAALAAVVILILLFFR